MNEIKIEKMIYILRGHRVMLDTDLAELYNVPTKRLNEQVRRNLERFPEDFMFQLNQQELNTLMKQFPHDLEAWGGRRYLPIAFTECGVAMLSSVLNSPTSISVNITIMRTFVRLRSFLAMDNAFDERLTKLEVGTNKLFRVVFERLDEVDEKLSPKIDPTRKRIGLKK